MNRLIFVLMAVSCQLAAQPLLEEPIISMRTFPQEFIFPDDCDQIRPTQEEEDFFISMNQYREENGCPALPYSPRLSCLALRHTEDQVILGLTHDWIAGIPPGFFSVFEISCSSTNLSGCFRLWKQSSGHNATILELAPFTDIGWIMAGVGAANGYSNVYFTFSSMNDSGAFFLEEPEPPIEPEPLISTNHLIHSYFVNNQLGGQSIILVGDDQNRISGTIFTYNHSTNPTWRNFIADQIEFNRFEGTVLRVRGTVDDGASEFINDGTIILSIVDDTTVEIGYSIESLLFSFQGSFNKFEVNF